MAKRSVPTACPVEDESLTTLSSREQPNHQPSANKVVSIHQQRIIGQPSCEAARSSSSAIDQDSNRHNSKQTDRFYPTADLSQQELDVFGLNGILSAVRLSQSPLSLLSLGIDLTTLGLNLNASDTLYSSFYSPNMDQQPSKEDVEFYLPPCCYVNPPSWKMAHLQKFTPETLFYMFYTIVGDVLQGYAAAELFNRGWFYHTEYEKWFTTTGAQRAIRASGSCEQQAPSDNDNTWIYFEPSLWTRRFYTGDLDVGKFLKSDALRELLEEPLQAEQQAEQQAAQQQAAQQQAAQQQAAQQQAAQQQAAQQQAAQQQQALNIQGMLSQQVAGLLSQQQQQQYNNQGLGALGGLSFHPGVLNGNLRMHPFGGHLQGGGAPIPSSTAPGFVPGPLLSHVPVSAGPAVGNHPNSVSMASLQNAIEALLTRGLPQQ